MKKLTILSAFIFLFTLSATKVLAGDRILNQNCQNTTDCKPGLICKDTILDPNDTSTKGRFCVQSDVGNVIGQVVPPNSIARIGNGAEGLNNFINRAVELIYIFATIIFVFMVIISALQWITSGGDKEGVSKARDRLTHAIIGIILLALAFVILKVVGQVTGFEFFAGQNNPLPTPTPQWSQGPF